MRIWSHPFIYLWVTDCGWSSYWEEVWSEWGGHNSEGVRPGHCSLHMPLRLGVCMVMGTVGMVGAQWDLPSWNSLGRAEHKRVCEHVLHFHRSPDFPAHVVPPQVLLIFLLCCVGDHNDNVHLLLPAGDEEGSHWGDVFGLGAPLVLVQVCALGRWSQGHGVKNGVPVVM